MTLTDEPTTAEAPVKEVGNARLRKEDARLITGKTNWTDNMVLPGMLHMAFLRSPVAHATISHLDVSAAKDRPNVVAVYTGQDFKDEQGTIPCAWPVTPDMVNPGHPSIAVDTVNHVGEAVAIVVARTRTAAVDAVEAIDVDYENLPSCWTWRRRPRTARTSCTPRRRPTPATTSSSTPARPARAATPTPPSATRRSPSPAASCSSASSRRSWSPARRSWACRATPSRCGRPPRSRTSCGSWAR